MTMDELGVAVLDDLRENMSPEDIARVLADFGAATPDGATRRLRAATGGRVDLNDGAHRLAAITWLRAWGCRHLRRADTPRTTKPCERGGPPGAGVSRATRPP